MKRLFSFGLAVVLSYSVYAQQSGDKQLRAKNEAVFNKLIKYYNTVQADSLRDLYSTASWTMHTILSMQQDFGMIVSYKYIGSFKDEVDTKGNLCVYFKASFSKPAMGNDAVVFKGKTAHAVCICLDKNGKIAGEAFPTSSPVTDSLIANY